MKYSSLLKKSLAVLATLSVGTLAYASTIGTDDASQSPVYDGIPGWDNGDNGGSGFLAWDLANFGTTGTGQAEYFIGDSDIGAGNINTPTDRSFGIFAHNNNSGGTAFADADRGFAGGALNVGQMFTIDLALNFDNGNKGISLYTGGAGATEVFNFNVNLGGTVAANGTDDSGNLTYDYGGNDAFMNMSFSLVAANTLRATIFRRTDSGDPVTGTQGTLYDQTFTVAGAPDAFRLYVNSTDNGDASNNLYANNLAISPIPEPSTLAMMGLVVIGLMAVRRHRG